MSAVNGIGPPHAAIHDSIDRLNRVAARISESAPDGDLAGDLIELRLVERTVQANAAVIKTQDELVGTILDLLA